MAGVVRDIEARLMHAVEMMTAPQMKRRRHAPGRLPVEVSAGACCGCRSAMLLLLLHFVMEHCHS
jgi:hypothetical protein